MKKILVAVISVITLFAAQNANGQETDQQTNENTFVLVQSENLAQLVDDETLVSTGTPVEIISSNEEISLNNDYCNFGVGRYSGEVSIHYYNDCDKNIQIGFKYKFKRCCPSCDCPWSAVQTDYATLQRKTSKRNYKTLKQGNNQNLTYYPVDYWER
jgi:hypothetical protein